MLKGFKKRQLAVVIGACMMLPSAAAYALGMGEIEVHSALNEPLKAQIKLLSTTVAEVNALQVALASNEAFSRMGIERTAALRDLRFSVVTQGAGAPYISIKSDVPMREPFLDLILMASWSNGQLMREYTLLLDPPVFDDSQAVAAVRAAKTQSAAIDRGQKKVVEAAPVAKPTPRTTDSYGPTTRTDTLWHVAREMRPSSSVSVPQMMMALLKENPEAFVDGNVNNLKAGHILRLPSKDVINSITSADAVAETNRHYQAWQSADVDLSAVNQRAVSAPAKVAPAAKASAPEAAASTNARLKLLSPEDAKQQGGAGGAGKGKGGVTEQLALALETAEATKQENAELKVRLLDIERQLQAVQRLLTLKGDTLGALQAGAAQDNVVAVDPQTVASTAVESAAVDVAADPAGSADDQSEVVAAAPADSSESGLIEQIMADPVLLAAAAGGPLLFLLLVALIRRRRSSSQEVDTVVNMPPIGRDIMPNAAGSDSGPTIVKPPAAKPQSFSEVIEESASPDFGASAGMGAMQTEDSEIDPIAEADVYLAYRRYEQAEALLKEAIRQDGERSELKLKLLEIYFTTKDKDAFEAQAEALYASLDGQDDEGLWEQAVEMGREIASDHPLFAESGGAATSGAALTGAAGAVVAVAGESAGSDFADEFSFDLSDDDLANSLNISSSDGGKMAVGEELMDLDGVEQDSFLLDDIDFSAEDEFSLDAGIEVLDEAVSEVDFEQLSRPQKIEPLTVVGSAKTGSKGEDWTIAPAISSFQSRDVKAEMDDGYVPVTNVSKNSADIKNLDHLSLGKDEPGLHDGLGDDMFDGGNDIVGTKLDLARAYIDMGDQSGARSILNEVVKEGGDTHRQEAEQLMRQIS